MSAYRTAIGHTTQVIEGRARSLRNQIVVVVAIGALVVLAAVVTRSAPVLWAFLLLVPACGLFFYADSKALNEWRAQLLASWIKRDIDFAALCESIRANPVLPKRTTEGMLMTLPSCGSLVAEQKLLTPTRQAIAAASLALHRGQADQLLINVVAGGIVVSVLLAAVWTRSWAPLLGLATLALFPLVRAWAARRRGARCEAEVAACRTVPGFNEDDYARIVKSLR